MSTGNIILLDTIDSTNNFLKSNTDIYRDRTVVIAECQTAGRGRFTRSFISESGGLYMSVLLKTFSAELLTVCAGVSVADVLCDLGADGKIKWVNDIYCHGKKVCGILAEVVNNCAVVGIGVNIKHNDSLPDVASSLERLYGITIDAVQLGKMILDKFYGYLIDQTVIDRYRHYTAYMIGKHITYNHGEGIVTGISDNGNLMIKDLDGADIVLNSGEISVRLESF